MSKVKTASVDSEIESTIEVPVPKPEFALVTWVNAQIGNEAQSSTRIAVHCTLMTRYCSLTRETILKKLPAIYEYLLKFRLNMHIGTGATPLKTEAMYFPPPRRLYFDADTSRLDVPDQLGNPVGFIDFTTEFKYLGSIVHHSLTSDADVDKRIRSVSAAFRALKII
jgi:hypothetical protein